MTIRARFDGQVLVPVDPLDLPKDQLVEIAVLQRLDEEDPPRGTPAALLKVMRNLTPVSAEDAAALERAIEEGQMPVDFRGIFDEDDQSEPDRP